MAFIEVKLGHSLCICCESNSRLSHLRSVNSSQARKFEQHLFWKSEKLCQLMHGPRPWQKSGQSLNTNEFYCVNAGLLCQIGNRKASVATQQLHKRTKGHLFDRVRTAIG